MTEELGTNSVQRFAASLQQPEAKTARSRDEVLGILRQGRRESELRAASARATGHHKEAARLAGRADAFDIACALVESIDA